MKWLFKEPALGDMIRVKLGDIYHYGVFSSEDEVIQFGLAPSLRFSVPENEVEVCSTDIDGFLAGGFLEVAELDKKELKKRIPSNKTVEFARSKLGERGYNILFNNCEHFAYLCIFGKKFSTQTDSLEKKLSVTPVLDVYIAQIPVKKRLRALYPAERDNEVKSIKNESLRHHKYYAWRLLEYAVLHSFGYKLKKLEVKKETSGRWVSPDFEFSLSHSGNTVAVAVSRKNVGVDIQLFTVPKAEQFAERTLTKKEFDEFLTLSKSERSKSLIKKWTQKESIFKSLNLPHYCPAEIDTNAYNTFFEELQIFNESYYLSVAGEDISAIRIFRNVKLK